MIHTAASAPETAVDVLGQAIDLLSSLDNPDPHNLARGAYVSVNDVEQPAPAPRYSRTPAAVRGAPPERGEGGLQALKDWGFGAKDIEGLKSRGLGTRE